MSKEIYISTTPHETRLAIVEDEQLAEIYYERENEYTLAGSIYNGRVTRVLPGMQSSFVDIGLERDAFLYVTDFMEEQGEAADFDAGDGAGRRQSAGSRDGAESRSEGSRERQDRGRSRRGMGERSSNDRSAQVEPPSLTESTVSFDEPIAPAPSEGALGLDEESATGGSRRWRGRRGRRRGRGARDEGLSTEQVGTSDIAQPDTNETMSADEPERGFVDGLYASGDQGDNSAQDDAGAQTRDVQPSRGRARGRGRERGRGRSEASAEPMFDNSYAGYGTSYEPEVTDGPAFLPGERIRKYRDPAEVAAEEAEALRNAPEKPTIEVVSHLDVEIVGWDGGAVLPGETLGRHRSGGRNAGSAAPVRVPEAQGPHGGKAHLSASEDGVVETSETFVFEGQHADLTDDAAPTRQDVAASGEAEPLPVNGKQHENAAEFEPEEGASATLGTDSRRDLRRLEKAAAQPKNTATAERDEYVGEPDATTYDLHGSTEAPSAHAVAHHGDQEQTFSLHAAPPEFTTLQLSGEMLSLDVEAGGPEPYVHVPAPQDALHPANPAALEGAVHNEEPVLKAEPAVPISQDDEVVGVHAYGEGDFQEEELDEELDGEDFEYQAAYVSLEEGDGEYEEETLDEASERDEAPQEEAPRGSTPEVQLHTETVAEDDDTIRYTGGFTEEDFGGEPADDEDADAASAPSQSSSQRDSGRRSGFGRERRGSRSGGDRGRGGRRQSVQTMDLPAINDLLKPGQEVLVQIAKEPIAKKGARITSHIALPGRFLVFMPTVNHTGVSRKISSDEERRRLKSLLLAEKGEAQGGFIVRTAAAGATDEELRNDLRFLIQMWTDIKARSESSKSPALIYHDLNLVERILRDQVTDNFSAIWVDTEAEYERVLRFLQRFQPSLLRRVKLYTKETPMFEHFGVTGEIDKALKSKVWLKSGGSIVINQTEALVAIDINTGKYVGKTARLEDTILKTNLDAIPEIVRQIRLRDLGGIIVIDFIDMDERKNRAKVLQTLEDAMKVDRAPSKILPFNDFGLVIMTRKRVKQSLERTLCIPDSITEGTGMIKSPITIANEIYVEMRKMHRHLEKTDVMLRVHPEVVKTLKANGGKRLQELEEMTRKTILVKSDPALSPEAFDIH